MHPAYLAFSLYLLQGVRRSRQMDKLISICIPTYCRLNYLKEAVRSALEQTYPYIEVLISQDSYEDGSLDDDIRTWSENIASNNPKVRYRYNSKKLGLAGNWNACVDAASGDYLVIIGDDDRLLPTFSAKMISEIKDADVAFSHHHFIDGQGNRMEAQTAYWTDRYRRNHISPGELVDPEIWVWQNSIPISSTLIRRLNIQQKYFKEDLNTPEIEFFMRLAKDRIRFIFVPEYLSEYRMHSKSETAQGLNTDRLGNYLLLIPAHPEAEPYKRELLSGFMTELVHKYLLKGDQKKAKEFFYNEYYPKWQWVHIKNMIRAICINLPPRFGCQIYSKLVKEYYQHWHSQNIL